MLNKKQYIRKFLKSRIGDPVVSACEGELNAIETALELAVVDYWISFPYVKKRDYAIHTTCGELVIDVEAQQNILFTDPAINDDAYALGVVRYDMTPSTIPTMGDVSNHFDRRLLGANAGSYASSMPTQDPRYSADRMMYYESTLDMWTGELDIYFDTLDNKLRVIHPPVEGQIHLWWAWGFCTCKTIDLIPMNHMSIFKRMVALQFIEIVLASRSAISLSADYQVDVTDLTNKRDRLQEELDKEMPELAIFVAQWG